MRKLALSLHLVLTNAPLCPLVMLVLTPMRRLKRIYIYEIFIQICGSADLDQLGGLNHWGLEDHVDWVYSLSTQGHHLFSSRMNR